MTESTELVLQKRQRDIAFADIEDFNDAWRLVEEAFGTVESASSLGDGFAQIDKVQLVGQPMLLLYWQFQDSDLSDMPFAIVRAMTKDGRRIVFIDGSTGIRDQLLDYSKNHDGRNGGILAEKGLRESNYTTTLESGKEINATTFYLDTAM